eukprot:74654-Hanusia_phi.AAC.2
MSVVCFCDEFIVSDMLHPAAARSGQTLRPQAMAKWCSSSSAKSICHAGSQGATLSPPPTPHPPLLLLIRHDRLPVRVSHVHNRPVVRSNGNVVCRPLTPRQTSASEKVEEGRGEERSEAGGGGEGLGKRTRIP